MPGHDRQALEAALDKIASAAGSGLAALVTEGWYMAATNEWWMMQAREVLMLQHIASAAPEVGLRRWVRGLTQVHAGLGFWEHRRPGDCQSDVCG